MDNILQIREKLEYDRKDNSIVLDAHVDKVIFPERILHLLVEEQKRLNIHRLPHPLVFRLSTFSMNTYVGVLQFHDGDPNRIYLSSDVCERLNICGNGNKNENTDITNTHNGDEEGEGGEENDNGNGDHLVTLNVELALNVSGYDDHDDKSSIEIKPHEVYSDITDWKSFLEATLSSRYTAVTTGDTLYFDINNKTYILDVTNVKTSKGIRTACVVDRDVELTIKGESNMLINESGNNSDTDNVNPEYINIGETEGILKIGRRYQFEAIEKGVKVLFEGDFVSDVDMFVNFDRFKHISVNEIDKSEIRYPFVYILGDGNGKDVKYRICNEIDIDNNVEEGIDDENFKKCGNCGKLIAIQSYTMHFNFCNRNTVSCPVCNKNFMKQIPETHWICCNKCGEGEHSFNLHKRYYHEKGICDLCEFSSDKFVDICYHKSNECFKSLHICKYCHLKLPRGESNFESKYHQCSRHEWECGSKTTKCDKCNKFIQLRMLEQHFKIHNIQRKNQELPKICKNDLCVNVINETENNNKLGLCSICFGSLYSSDNDPEGSKLRNRIERRYVMQLKNGCNNKDCDNKYCGNNKECIINDEDRKSIVKIVRFVKENLVQDFNKFKFCVSLEMNKRRQIIKIFEEIYLNEWSYEWVCLSNEKNGNDINKMKDWLEDNGVKINE